MQGNIKNYLQSMAGFLPPEIVSEATYRQINHMAGLFKDFAACEYIMETNLNNEAAEVDFSFRVLAEERGCLSWYQFGNHEIWTRIKGFVDFWSYDIADIWFEMDYSEYEKPIPRPCFFFNARQIKKGTYIDEQLLSGTLKPLLDDDSLQSLWPNLQMAVKQLPPQTGLFQIGVMLARHVDRVRIFTGELSREQAQEYLAHIGWNSLPGLEQLFQLVDVYSDGQYILDFDVSAEGISGKIGLNFGLDQQENLPAFLEDLIKHQLCTDVKRKGVLAWPGSKGSYLGEDYGYSALIKDISHFKISFSPEEGLKVKAYLRVAGVYLKELFKAAAAQRKRPDYKEMQSVFRQIAQKSMLDKEYRELCLKDSRAAIQKVSTSDAAIPDNIIFLEEDGEGLTHEGFAYILPPFLNPSWLTSK